jgi:hypothetical protein
MQKSAPHPDAPARSLINVAIRAELHRKLKMVAVSRGLTLQALVEKSIRSGIGDIPNSLELSQHDGISAESAPVDSGA